MSGFLEFTTPAAEYCRAFQIVERSGIAGAPGAFAGQLRRLQGVQLCVSFGQLRNKLRIALQCSSTKRSHLRSSRRKFIHLQTGDLRAVQPSGRAWPLLKEGAANTKRRTTCMT